VNSPVVEEADQSEWTYPKSYSVRPLTMEQGMVRANGIFTVWDDGVDTVFGMTLGGSIGVLDFAGDLIFVLPVDTAFALEVALPFRIKPNDRLSVDTGLEVRGTFGSAKRADIRIPAIVNYNFSDRAFISGETGVQFVNLGKGFNTATADVQGVAIPIGFRAGGTWKKVDKHLIDLFAGFAFPQLFEVGTSRSTIDFGIWDIFVGVAFYTRPLF